MQSTTYKPNRTAPVPQSDPDLIRSALRGEQGGYEGLTRRYQDRLFASMRGDVGCSTMAEDIVQEAFVRAFVHLDTFRGHSNFYTWLYRIALNSRRSYLRKNRVTVPLDSVAEVECQIDACSPDAPTRRIERNEEKTQVREALSRLDEPYRQILILREFEGFDYQTIADVLQVKMGTVRSRLARARARLKKELTSYVDAKPNESGSDSDFDGPNSGLTESDVSFGESFADSFGDSSAVQITGEPPLQLAASGI